jgi:CubicO group peptidase (beta-lactamase class C family)
MTVTASAKTTGRSLPRALPADHGVDPWAIAAFTEAAQTLGLQLHSFMVIRHGHVLAEAWWRPYRADLPHTAFSVAKSFTSTAIGMAVRENLLSIDEPLADFFPAIAARRLQRGARRLTVRHLLTMSTGHETDTMAVMRALPGYDWVQLFFDVPLIYPAGTHFLYNSGASFVLSAALQARAGVTLDEYLRRRLFQPLGIIVPPWATSPDGISLGASGLRLRTEDIAKLGLLYLQRGKFGGRRLLSADWTDQATSFQVACSSDAPDWSQGYGFQFWRSTHDSYRADGAYGQFSLVLPGLDAVIAITAGHADNWSIPPAVWEYLLPGIHPDGEPVPDSPDPDSELAERLAGLEIPAPSFLLTPPAREAQLAGQHIDLADNVLGIRRLRVDPAADSIALVCTDDEGLAEVNPAGRAAWLPGRTTLWHYDEPGGSTIASRAGWSDDHTLEFHQQCIGTAFRRIWRLTFGPGRQVGVLVDLDMPFWLRRDEVIVGQFSGG